MSMISPEVRSLITPIQHGGAEDRFEATQQAALVGTEAIIPLADLMAGSDPGAAKAAGNSLQRIVLNAGRPDNGRESAIACEKLSAIAADTKRPRDVRADAVRYLGCIGSGRVTATLAALLSESALREDAKLALERIPDPAAERALKSAASTMNTDYKPALEAAVNNRKWKKSEVGIRAGK